MTVTETTTAAVARRDTGPSAMVKQYGADFTAVLPSHIKPEQWIRLAQGALKKGRKQGARFELEIAAANNPGVFLATLLDAARLGLEPGTEEYHLTPRKVKGQLEILGIVGYQGIIELMYRAGAISSVVAECVYSNDKFIYRPGIEERPIHEIDWDAEDRGSLRLVYAYAIMKDGATSKVVVLNRQAIARIKAKSLGSDSQYSPWQTDEAAMWLKSGVRQLRKWVPTSAEYRTAVARTGQKPATSIEKVPEDVGFAPALDVSSLPEVGEDYIDAEVVDPADEQAAYEAQEAAK